MTVRHQISGEVCIVDELVVTMSWNEASELAHQLHLYTGGKPPTPMKDLMEGLDQHVIPKPR